MSESRTKRAKRGSGVGMGAPADDVPPPVDELGVAMVDSRRGPTPGGIANKMRRHDIFEKQKRAKALDKRERRKLRKEAREQLGDKAPPKAVPRTIENTREADETVVDPEDDEVAQDEATDELSEYFTGRTPKVIVTTTNRPHEKTVQFTEDLINVIPTAEYKTRRNFDIKKIVQQAIAKEYTDIIVVNEDRKEPNAIVHIHLPNGPTAHYKLSSVRFSKDVPNKGKATTHYPEVVLNNFHTRLGHQVGRMFMTLFPQQPEFQGRSVVTFHNQRDFIFVRRHRYIFRDRKRVGLQEIGPRFTLKLRSLQHGTFDTKFGEYEWLHRPEMNTSRRRFFL